MKPGWHSHLSFLALFQASKHQKGMREVDCKQYLSTRSSHTSAATCTPRYWSEARGQQVLAIFSVSGALVRELWACRPTWDWARPTGVFQALGEWDATQLLPGHGLKGHSKPGDSPNHAHEHRWEMWQHNEEKTMTEEMENHFPSP